MSVMTSQHFRILYDDAIDDEEVFGVEPDTGVDVFKVIEERWREYASTRQAREGW